MDAAPLHTLPPGGLAPDRVWWMRAPDGVRLRAAHWSGAGGDALAVLLSGRTEFLEKVALPAAALVARGYQVVSVDWRGQGLSDRAVEPGLKGHVGDFAEFQRDLDALLESDPVQSVAPGPRLLIGHSMGGAIATGALMRLEIAGLFDAAVLSAPMYGIAMAAPMRLAAGLVTRIGMALGLDRRWPPFGDVATPYVLSGAEPNVLTNDAEIWAWLAQMARDHAGLNLAMPTIGWFAAATREMKRIARSGELGLPALCLLGTDEAVVDPGAIRRLAPGLGLELVEIADAKHEHFHEADAYRSQAWSAIDGFLRARGLPVNGQAIA